MLTLKRFYFFLPTLSWKRQEFGDPQNKHGLWLILINTMMGQASKFSNTCREKFLDLLSFTLLCLSDGKKCFTAYFNRKMAPPVRICLLLYFWEDWEVFKTSEIQGENFA